MNLHLGTIKNNFSNKIYKIFLGFPLLEHPNIHIETPIPFGFPLLFSFAFAAVCLGWQCERWMGVPRPVLGHAHFRLGQSSWRETSASPTTRTLN